jgi:hypothetical protein
MPAKDWSAPPCDNPACIVHYGCYLRRKGVAPTARIHARQRSTVPPFRPPQDPSWEKGIVTTERPGGFQVPLLHGNGTPWRTKEAAENHRTIDQRLRETHVANTLMP